MDSGCVSSPKTTAHWDEPDFTTATDVVPVRVPLERVEIGRHRYVAGDLGDLELVYKLESSALCVNCGVRGLGGASPPASFSVTDISAADLSLVTVIPGSLESMVVRLMLETEEPIQCLIRPSNREETLSQKATVSDDMTQEDYASQTEREERELQVVEKVHSRILIVTASVHEAGHLRDVLLFLKGGYTGKVAPNAMFLNPKTPAGEDTDAVVSLQSSSDNQPVVSEATSSMTFLESLPVWARYVPWWVYSRNVRISIQNVLFFYSLFSIVWALWQLYRNVHIIQHVLQPIIAVIKEVYLASVIDAFDWCLAVFTEFWMSYLSPLNVLQALLLAPVLQAVVQLRNIFLPLGRLLYYILLGLWRCLPNTQLLAALKNLFVAVYSIATVLGQLLWDVMHHLMRPVQLIWQGLLNSRIAVGSLDLNRIKLSWVMNLIVGSVRAIGSGVAKLCGYTSRRRKLKMAKTHQYMSPVRQTRSSTVHPLTPVYYSSPLAKTGST